MKKYFYVILINLHLREESTGVTSQKVSRTGIIEIEEKEDKSSLIYDKILKGVMMGWKPLRILGKEVEFFNFWEEKEMQTNLDDQKSEIILSQNQEEIDEILNKPIQDLDISVRGLNILKSKLLKTLGDVILLSERELRLRKGFNDGLAFELRQALKAFGLKLAEPKSKNL